MKQSPKPTDHLADFRRVTEKVIDLLEDPATPAELAYAVTGSLAEIYNQDTDQFDFYAPRLLREWLPRSLREQYVREERAG